MTVYGVEFDRFSSNMELVQRSRCCTFLRGSDGGDPSGLCWLSSLE